MQRILQFIIDFLSKFLEPEPTDVVIYSMVDDKVLVEFARYVKSLPAFSVYWCRTADDTYIKTEDGEISVILTKSKSSKQMVWRLTSKISNDAEYYNEFPSNKANDDLMFSAMNAVADLATNAILDKMTITAPKAPKKITKKLQS